VSTYTELKIQDQPKTTDSCQLASGQLQECSQQVWVITPVVGDGKTIEASQTKEFLNNIEPWNKMNSHPTILEMYGHGSEPFPWLALEAGDHRFLADVAPESSLSEKQDISRKPVAEFIMSIVTESHMSRSHPIVCLSPLMS